MADDDYLNVRDKFVRIFMRNGFKYEGTVQDETQNFIVLFDNFKSEVFHLNKSEIAVLKEISEHTEHGG